MTARKTSRHTRPPAVPSFATLQEEAAWWEANGDALVEKVPDGVWEQVPPSPSIRSVYTDDPGTRRPRSGAVKH